MPPDLAGSKLALGRRGFLGRTHELRQGEAVIARLNGSGRGLTIDIAGETLLVEGVGKDAEGSASPRVLDQTSGRALAFLQDSDGERLLSSEDPGLRPREPLRFRRVRVNEWGFLDSRSRRFLRLHAARASRGHMTLERSPDGWPADNGPRAELLAALLGCALLLPRTRKAALERDRGAHDFSPPVMP